MPRETANVLLARTPRRLGECEKRPSFNSTKPISTPRSGSGPSARPDDRGCTEPRRSPPGYCGDMGLGEPGQSGELTVPHTHLPEGGRLSQARNGPPREKRETKENGHQPSTKFGCRIPITLVIQTKETSLLVRPTTRYNLHDMVRRLRLRYSFNFCFYPRLTDLKRQAMP